MLHQSDLKLRQKPQLLTVRYKKDVHNQWRMPQFCWNPLFLFIPSCLEQITVCPHTRAPQGASSCGSGIVTRRAGSWPWALGALQERGQWLHLFPIEKHYRSWRPWLITRRQTSEYSHGKVQLFNSSHTQSIQTSCWRSSPSSLCSFFTVTTAFHSLSLPIYRAHNYLRTQLL